MDHEPTICHFKISPNHQAFRCSTIVLTNERTKNSQRATTSRGEDALDGGGLIHHSSCSWRVGFIYSASESERCHHVPARVVSQKHVVRGRGWCRRRSGFGQQMRPVPGGEIRQCNWSGRSKVQRHLQGWLLLRSWIDERDAGPVRR